MSEPYWVPLSGVPPPPESESESEFAWRGEWNAATSYLAGNYVYLNRRYWLATSPSVGKPPGSGFNPPPPPVAPLAWWPLDDLGAVMEDIAGDREGTFVGAPVKGVQGANGSLAMTFAAGVRGNAPHSSAVFDKPLWSLAGWIRATSLGTGYVLYKPPSAGGQPYPFWMSISAGKMNAGWLSGGTSYQATDPTNVLLNTWMHFVATWDGTTCRLYRDAVQVASVAKGWDPAFNTMDVWVGSGFPGTVDEVMFFGVTLTPAQIATLRAGMYAPYWLPYMNPDQAFTA